jgi:hypothetical protein
MPMKFRFIQEAFICRKDSEHKWIQEGYSENGHFEPVDDGSCPICGCEGEIDESRNLREEAAEFYAEQKENERWERAIGF